MKRYDSSISNDDKIVNKISIGSIIIMLYIVIVIIVIYMIII